MQTSRLIGWSTAAAVLACTAEANPAPPAPRVEIVSVKPDKIVYSDGEAGRFTVRVANPLQEPQTVTLRSTLKWDLEESRPLPPVTLTVPPQGEATVTNALPRPVSRWGHEVCVDAVVNGQTTDTGRQFFGVNSDWMDLAIVMNEWPHTVADESPFIQYTTLQHWFAWAPGDYVGNAPPYDEWYSGQTGYHTFKKDIQKTIAECHRAGIHCTFYNNSFSNGKEGVEWARRHPEWVCRERNGMPKLSGSAFALALPPTNKATGADGYVQIDFYDRKCIEWGVQNVLDSIRMFGWDGMFWDCGGCALFPGFSYDGQPTPHGQDPDRHSARNFRLFIKGVRREFPSFAFWYNGSIEFYKLPFWSSFGNGGGIPTYETQMSAPNSCMLAEFRAHEAPGTEFSNWRRCYDAYARERDAITQPFGTPVTAGYTWGYDASGDKGPKVQASRAYWVAGNHLSALYLATQMHTTSNPNPSLWAGTQFMTRYSGLLWGRDVKIIPAPRDLLDVSVSRPVWWEKSVYRRPTRQGDDIVVHLVNVPETETVDIYRAPDPPAAAGRITLTIPPHRQLRSAWALQMRGYVDDGNRGGAPYRAEWRGEKLVHTSGSACRFGPLQTALTARMEGDKATVDIPPFLFHQAIVFRLEK